MTCSNDNTLVITPGDDVVFAATFPVGTNLTGATVYLAVLKTGETTLAVDLANTTHTSPTTGVTTFTIPRSTTLGMTPDAPHQGVLRMKSSGGAITTLGGFPVKVVKPISTRNN